VERASVDEFTLKGQFVRTLVSSQSLPGLQKPNYLCIHNDQLLISDYGSECIFRVDLATGRLSDTLRHPLLEKPRQVCVDVAGNVYVASYGCGVVLVMSPAGQWHEILTSEKHGQDGYPYPTALGVSQFGLVVSWCGMPPNRYTSVGGNTVVKAYKCCDGETQIYGSSYSL
jgi:hypothetical protein